METKIQSLGVAELMESKTNPRGSITNESVKELSNSIKEQGIMIPIVATIIAEPKHGLKYEIVDGHRRFRAAKMLDLQKVPVMVVDWSPEEVKQAQIVANLQRADLHPMDEAKGFQGLIQSTDPILTFEEAAKKVGKTLHWVTRLMQLNKLTPEIQKAFRGGEIAYEVAYVLARLPQEIMPKAFKEIKGLSVHEASRAIDDIEEEFMMTLNKAEFDTNSNALLVKAGSCSLCPKRTGNQAALFSEDERKANGDRCLDRECFSQKTQIHRKAILAQAKKDGKKIVVYGDKMFYSASGIKLDEKNWNDEKERTHRQLLKGLEYETFLKVDTNGKIEELASVQSVISALKTAGRKDVLAYYESRNTDSSGMPKKTDAQKIDEKATVIAVGHLVRMILTKAPGLFTKVNTAITLMMANTLIDMADSNTKRVVCKAIGLKQKNSMESWHSITEKHVKSLSVVQKMGFGLALYAIGLRFCVGLEAEQLPEIASLLKIDVKKLKAESVAEVKKGSKKQSKSAKPKASKKPVKAKKK